MTKSKRYRICKNCEWIKGGSYYFNCYVDPPQFSGDHGDGKRPRVSEDDYCSKWTPIGYSDNPAIKAAWDEFVTLHLLAKNYD